MSFNSATGLWQANLNTTTPTKGAHNVDVVNYGTLMDGAISNLWDSQTSVHWDDGLV